MRHWIICYDIEDNKERTRIYKCLLRYGTPIQKSVFEVSFPERKRHLEKDMIQQLEAIASEYANIRFYNITERGKQNSWSFNHDLILNTPGAIII